MAMFDKLTEKITIEDIRNDKDLYIAVAELLVWVDKAEPMIPLNLDAPEHEMASGVCSCGNTVTQDENYCPSCGQKLDWDVESNHE